MANLNLIPVEQLRQILSYDPDTGKLHWLVRAANHIPAGSPALQTPDAQGYARGEIAGKAYKAHRVAWALHFGEWPRAEIDHINGVHADNRLANLREATKSENQHNKSANANNTSGYKGVTWNKQNQKWKAAIKAKGKAYHLGLFHTAEEAYAAYCEASANLHGAFAKG